MSRILAFAAGFLVCSILAAGQLSTAKDVPNLATTKELGAVYGFGGTGKVIIAVDAGNRDFVVTVFDSIHSGAGVVILSQSEAGELLAGMKSAIDGPNASWKFTTALTNPRCSLGCLTVNFDSSGTSVGTYLEASPPERRNAISNKQDRDVLLSMVRLLDPGLKVLTGQWMPPTAPATKAERKAAAKAAKEEQKRAEAAEKQRMIGRCYQLTQIPLGQLTESQRRSLESCRYLEYVP